MPRRSGIASWKRCAPSDGHPLRFAAMPKQRRPPRRAANFQRLLLLAAETGKRADIAEATHAVERVLRDRCLLSTD